MKEEKLQQLATEEMIQQIQSMCSVNSAKEVKSILDYMKQLWKLIQHIISSWKWVAGLSAAVGTIHFRLDQRRPISRNNQQSNHNQSSVESEAERNQSLTSNQQHVNNKKTIRCCCCRIAKPGRKHH